MKLLFGNGQYYQPYARIYGCDIIEKRCCV